MRTTGEEARAQSSSSDMRDIAELPAFPAAAK
jgi:2-oxoglutarate dehydrogenase complex dehydrogenase (E1) component-like enzyme